MAWIESHQALGRHPKLIRMSAMLRIHKAQAIGHLQYLWWWALDYAPTGDLSAFTPAEVSAGAEWPGEPGPFHDALRECGWLDEDGMLHDWGDYAGKLLEVRDLNRERQARYRERCNVTRTSRVSSALHDAQPNQTKPNIPNPTIPEEKSTSLLLKSASTPPVSVPPISRANDRDEEIYQAYPRHVGRAKALIAIRKARKAIHARGEAHPGEWLLVKVKAYAQARNQLCATRLDQQQFTPHPATWFNGGRYDDDPAEWSLIHEDRPQSTTKGTHNGRTENLTL